MKINRMIASNVIEKRSCRSLCIYFNYGFNFVSSNNSY